MLCLVSQVVLILANKMSYLSKCSIAELGPNCLANGSKVNQAIVMEVDWFEYRFFNFGNIISSSAFDKPSIIGKRSLAIVFEVTSATLSSASVVHLLYLFVYDLENAMILSGQKITFRNLFVIISYEHIRTINQISM